MRNSGTSNFKNCLKINFKKKKKSHNLPRTATGPEAETIFLKFYRNEVSTSVFEKLCQKKLIYLKKKRLQFLFYYLLGYVFAFLF